MIKRFKARVIKGKGRGQKLGMRTLNLKIPEGFDLKRGVWSCFLFFKGKKYRGLLHYGPRLTFGEKIESLEVLVRQDLGRKAEELIVEVGKLIRQVKKFDSEEELIEQVRKDWRKFED